MNTRHACGFIAFNLLSFISFTLMAANPAAGALCLAATAGVGLALPISIEQ